MLPVNFPHLEQAIGADVPEGPPAEAPVQSEQVDAKTRQRHAEFRQRIDSCKVYRRKLISNWTVSIDYRRGKPFTSQTDEDQIAVNLDWALTKSKNAALFSQIPQVRVNHPPETLQPGPGIKGFERKLNDKLIIAGIEAAMDEVLPDCINAAGIGLALVSYESIMENKQLPSMDMSLLPPELHAQVLQSGMLNGEQVPMESVPNPVDHRYIIERISPADFLWPINYTGSNFDKAPWIGRSGRMTWANAVQKFNLSEDDKDTVLGEDRPMLDKLTHDVERDKIAADDMVGFDELWYKEFEYDTDAKSFSTIHHLVYISGKDVPVIDEPWKGQRPSPDNPNAIIGVSKYPLRVLTLSYVTDETIPPSDSAIARPQINEINKARTQMIRQRERSLPVRWVDVNRLGPAVMQSLMRGTWQQFIPVQGDGSRVVGEVARAQMPQENFMFDKIAKSDANELWSFAPLPEDVGGTDQAQGVAPSVSPQTRIGRERAKVASFFCGISEVLGGLMCLFEDTASFGEGFTPELSTILGYSILADSTVLLDANQKLARLTQFLNITAKSGWIDIGPVMAEIASLSGLDPNVVVKPPQPKPPVEPNISLRLTGVEDMLNPLTLAFLIKSGQAPPPELIEQAKQLIQQAVTIPGGMPGDPNGGGPPMGTPVPPGAPMMPSVSPPPEGNPTPMPAPPKVGEAHPNWTAMPKLDKRTEGGQ